MTLSTVEGLGNAEVLPVRFALVCVLAFSPADFHVDLGIPLSLFADDIAHGLTSPNIWCYHFFLSLNMPIVKGTMRFFLQKNFYI
jgi:hypothetical protein